MRARLVSREDNLVSRENAIRFLKWRKEKYPNHFAEPRSSIERHSLDERVMIQEPVPREAIEYMDIDSYYSILTPDESSTVHSHAKIFDVEKIREIVDVVINAGRNADLDRKESERTVKERVEKGVVCICEFAIKEDLGVYMSE